MSINISQNCIPGPIICSGHSYLPLLWLAWLAQTFCKTDTSSSLWIQYLLTLKLEAVCSCQRSGHLTTGWCRYPREDSQLWNYRILAGKLLHKDSGKVCRLCNWPTLSKMQCVQLITSQDVGFPQNGATMLSDTRTVTVVIKRCWTKEELHTHSLTPVCLNYSVWSLTSNEIFLFNSEVSLSSSVLFTPEEHRKQNLNHTVDMHMGYPCNLSLSYFIIY
jgi:hypothetical protein